MRNNPVQMLLQSLTLMFIAMFYPKLFSIETLYYLVGGVMILVGVFYAVTIPALVKKDEEKRAAMTSSEKIPATS